MLRARVATIRLAIAVLALLGQLTPAVALPVSAVLRSHTSAVPGCAPVGCACTPIEKALTGCCCNKPEPPSSSDSAPPKSCCKPPEVPKRERATEAKITPGGKCCCDKKSGTSTATAEPAVPAVVAPLALGDHESRPELPRWAPLTTALLLPPPSPPPRTAQAPAEPLTTAP
ncbi:hypothetical protein VT84_23835 [Gemmata sp. SH-PL17]|uniref:hypothetical protein n=1 Tax=Gemmata sp. SH-PL17 TaxID=1630693 RepID=UPI00078E666E|nr:hypothetical protein [Gemmata sp. SH-PL17]AMV27452.1 hypothetical protein VT84_23835 [Gemmata sp. SH-PL17]